jgi:hypothetical protein
VTISRAAVASTVSPFDGLHDSDDEPQLLAGTQTLKRSGTGAATLQCFSRFELYLGFTKSVRTPKRLKDIVPEDVVVEASASEVEDSDLEMSPSKPTTRQRGKQRGKQKKAKKSDGWIWLESLTRGQKLGDDKLAAYKMESKCVMC